MQAAQILAGYTLGQADLLRRAMGKKIRKEMQEQRKHFVKGATERGIDRTQADAIFDLLERFAEYGFNKSHAAAYALVAYQTAYMKANYPVEFLAASMTLDMDNTDKLVGVSRRGRAARHQGRAALRQSLRRRVRRRRQHHSLRAGGAQRRRRAGGRVDRRGARRQAVRRSGRFRAPHQSARRQQARAGKPRRLGRVRQAGAEPRARAFAAIDTHARRPRSAATRRCRSGRTNCSAVRPAARSSCCRRPRPGCRRTGCGANTTRSASSCPAIRSTTTPRCSRA